MERRDRGEMATARQSFVNDDKDSEVITIVIDDGTIRDAELGRQTRFTSGRGVMHTIRESGSTTSGRGAIHTIRENEPATPGLEDHMENPLLHESASGPSLVRRLSRLLPSRALSQRLSAIRTDPFVNLGNGRGWTNIDDGNEVELVAVDISTLGGFGYGVHNVDSPITTTPPSPAMTPVGPVDEPAAVEERLTVGETNIRRRHGFGEGLSNSLRVRRDSTILEPGAVDDRELSSAQRLQRAKTVRMVGQRIAEKENKIVAVDLSSLEGNDLLRQPTFDDGNISRQYTAGTNMQSYYFPKKDNENANWKPFSISGPYILSLTALALLLAGFQEYLCQWSIREERNHSGILAFNKVARIPTAAFFAWKYLPTMITIIYAVLFSIMDFDIRRLEPYYQLSQPRGSPASASLNLDHLTMFQYLVPFNAIRLKQWAVAFSTFGNIIAATVAPALQNPSFNFVENDGPGCATNDGCNNGEMKYFVRIDRVWSRLMSASYIIIALITVVLFIQMRRKSGLLNDPKGIAGIASMATKSHILQEFRGLDLATRAKIHRRLAHRRFILYESTIYQGEILTERDNSQESDSRLKTPHPPMLRLSAAIPFIGYMVVCLVFVPLISLTSLNIIPNKAPWLPILVATILKLLWSTFEADVRLMEPFYQLSKGNAKPENSLTLDYQATVYGIMPFIAAFNGHFLVAIVGVTSVLLDILSVTAGSFSVSADMGRSSLSHNTGDVSLDDETSVSFTTSLVLSMVILTFAIFTSILVYARRNHPFLPREPSTIAAVLAFIWTSKMLDDFIDTERMSSKQLEEKLKRGGKRYGLGWFKGRDGGVYCAIDEEPMRSKYQHNIPYSSAVVDPRMATETY